MKTPACRFFGQGLCRNGNSCSFTHDGNTTTHINNDRIGSASADIQRLNIDPVAAGHNNRGTKPSQVCKFFLQGSCHHGDRCRNLHALPLESHSQVQLGPASQAAHAGQQATNSPHAHSDSRATVPCKFFSHPGGCQKSSCPYLHVVQDPDGAQRSDQDSEADEDKDQDNDPNPTRSISGASVRFGEFGHVLDISFPTDFSLVCITGLASGTTPNAVINIMRGFGFKLRADCVRILRGPISSATKATLKVKDPLFAKSLSDRLKMESSKLCAVPMSIDTRQPNRRKVHVSWHKATRSAWLNFGKGDIAKRVAQKYNDGKYKCMSSSVKSSTPTWSGNGVRRSFNSVPWTITLSDVPGDATSIDVEQYIVSAYDKPRHVEMGPVSYHASEAEVSVVVRSHLEEHGPLESFYLAPTFGGKRAKATAWFQDEADAKLACSLNNVALDILSKGKLTVTLVHSAKIKVATTVYSVSKSTIDEQSNTWRQKHLMFHVYTDALQPLTTLKVEGASAKDVAMARRGLGESLNGVVLAEGNNILWSPVLGSNGIAYQKLRSIEKDLDVVIIREKSKRQLRFHGPVEKSQQVIRRINDMLKEEPLSSFGIDVNSQQYDTDLAIMNSVQSVESRPVLDIQLDPEEACPICFCEAEVPIQTSCKHKYCLECLIGYCESDTSCSQETFRVVCCGTEGTCSTVFTLRELRTYLPSSVFESVLKKSFEEYVKRRPEDFRSCPTPDCGYLYRCSKTNSLQSPTYTCPNCFEQLCTSCHAQHGAYTCADYKDIASGGVEALEKLKKELNIKDCPKCKTPMEKIMGCNHMTCGGCKAHICWVCMAVYETANSCYEHMTKEHGGIGHELEQFMD